MILDMNGKPKQIIKKNKRTKNKTDELTPEELAYNIAKLLEKTTSQFCIFFKKNDTDYRASNCNYDEIDHFVKTYKKDKLKSTIYECLDNYFFMNFDDDFSEEDAKEIAEQQEFIEALIKGIIKHDNDEDD